MHARQLIELAAWIATHGAALVRMPTPLSASGLNLYWSSAKCRLDRWGRELKHLSSVPEAAGPKPPRSRSSPRPLLEEVLTGEILARVSAAVFTAHDRRRQTNECEPLARNLLQGQLDARQRVLNLIANSPVLDPELAVELNRLRRRCERWSDLLIAKLLLADDVLEFAVEPDRAADFAEGLREKSSPQAWPILLGSLQAAFQNLLAPHSPNADLNEQIAAGLLSCFPGESFDAYGLVPSLWLVRMSHTTSDAQGMIDDMLAIESGARSSASPSTRDALPTSSRRPAGVHRRFHGPK